MTEQFSLRHRDEGCSGREKRQRKLKNTPYLVQICGELFLSVMVWRVKVVLAQMHMYERLCQLERFTLRLSVPNMLFHHILWFQH